jgi:hypothetical protein
VLAHRLGYRITAVFADRYLGRIFETPDVVFTEEILQPEKQDLEVFVSGIDAIVEAQQRVAMNYFEDGSVDAACPPLKALLHIMAHGQYEGMTEEHPSIREMFTRESLIASDWYKERLRCKQQRDIALWKRHVQALESFSQMGALAFSEIPLEIRLTFARDQLEHVSAPAYLDELVGTIGADPFQKQ